MGFLVACEPARELATCNLDGVVDSGEESATMAMQTLSMSARTPVTLLAVEMVSFAVISCPERRVLRHAKPVRRPTVFDAVPVLLVDAAMVL